MRSAMSTLFGLLLLVQGCGVLSAGVADEPTGQQQLLLTFLPEMGKGVDAAETRTFSQCVNFDPVVKKPLGFGSRLYDERMIKSRKDLDESLGVDTHVKASGLWGTVGASASYFKNVRLNDDSVFWLVNARYETESESLDMKSSSFGLTKLAKQLLQDHGLEAFTKACGTHFYTGRILGGRYSLLYEFKSSEGKVLEKIKTAASYEGFGLSADAEFSKALQNAVRTSSLTVHSDSEGGGHEVGDAATDPVELRALLARLRQDLADNRQGKPLVWDAASYQMFPEVVAAAKSSGEDQLFNDFKRGYIKTYYDRFMDNQDRLAKIDGLVTRAHSPRPRFGLTNEHEAQLKALAIDLQEQNISIDRAARECFGKSQSCSLEKTQRIQSEVSLDPDFDMSGIGNWTVRIAVRPGVDQAIDFWAKPNQLECAARIFETRGVYVSRFSGVYRAGFQNGWRGPVALGSPDLLHDSRGNLQPHICTGDYKNSCSWRIVNLPGALGTDGCPVAIMEISILNWDGSVSETIEFNSFLESPRGAN